MQKSQSSNMSNCALSEKDEVELQDFTEDLGAIFISTPFRELLPIG